MLKRTEAAFDALEARRMMAVDAFRGSVWEVYGTRRDDHLVIEVDAKHPNYLIARNGDTILARAAASVVKKIRVFGGEGNDQVFIKVQQHYHEEPGKDPIFLRPYTISVDAGEGNDQVLSNSVGFSGYGGAGNDSLYGTAGVDHLFGGVGDDLLSGAGGRDYLDGGEGQDRIFGGDDNDTVFGGTGNDRIDGGNGRDLLEGGAGRDQLAGNAERDTLLGGKGVDLLTREQRQDLITPADNDIVQVQEAVMEWQADPRAYAAQQYTSSRSAYNGSHYGVAVIGWAMADSFTTNTVARAFNSQTNTQVDGIDEADIVENDGNYLYSVSGNKLIITDIRNPADLKVVSTTDFDGSITGLYLDGGRLTVIHGRSEVGENQVGTGISITMHRYWREVSSETVISTFDVSNTAAPVKLGETAIDGSYVSSRYANGRVYVVTNKWTSVPVVEGESVEGFWIPESEASFATRVRTEAGRKAPGYTATRRKTVTQGTLADVGRVVTLRGTVINDNSQTSISIINTAVPGAAPLSSMVIDNAWVQTTYMSGNNIYLVQGDIDGGTIISKFSVAGDQVAFEGRGRVAGFVRNQLALHETADGNLAVTYSSTNAETPISSSLTVLADRGDTLSEVDSITGIAPGDSLFATRYVGDRAYFVTYQRTDPLFVVDLSQPDDLKLLGELKIPGFSDYLHPIGENHLIGVGQRDDDEDGFSEGVQVSLFDVSNPASPKRIDTQNLSVEGWSYSPAQNDHLAFTYVPETGLFAMPLQRDNGGSSVEVLKVDVRTGIDRLLSIDGDAQRGAFANGAAFAIGDRSIKSALLTAPFPTDEVSFGGDEEEPGVIVE